MAATSSVMVALGTKAPDFSLPDTVFGRTLSLADCRGAKGTVIAFICNHCPYVKLIHAEMVSIAKEYAAQGVSWVSISANDPAQYPDDGPDQMTETARALGYTFPYLFDDSQEVARHYQAVCTPDIFVFDGDLKLVYRGQFDDARPGNQKPVTGRDLRQALDHLVAGMPVSELQIPSIGCNIKWKK